MSIEVYFENGTWSHKTDELTFCLPHEPTESDVQRLESLVKRVQGIVLSANDYASNSEYSSDIENNGGMTASTVAILEDWQFVVWFQLRDSNRYVGVRFSGNVPVDVYCDHP